MQLIHPPSGRSRSPPYSLFKSVFLKAESIAYNHSQYYIIFYAKAQQKFILAFLDGNWPIRLRSGQGLIGFVLFEPEGGFIFIILCNKDVCVHFGL